MGYSCYKNSVTPACSAPALRAGAEHVRGTHSIEAAPSLLDTLPTHYLHLSSVDVRNVSREDASNLWNPVVDAEVRSMPSGRRSAVHRRYLQALLKYRALTSTQLLF